MLKDEFVYAGHMLDTARDALELLGGQSRADYDADKSLRVALTHFVQMIGEAARRVSDDFRSQHAHIPWANIVAMRHRIVHDYLDVDDAIVWETVTDDLPALIEALEKIVPDA